MTIMAPVSQRAPQPRSCGVHFLIFFSAALHFFPASLLDNTGAAAMALRHHRTTTTRSRSASSSRSFPACSGLGGVKRAACEENLRGVSLGCEAECRTAHPLAGAAESDCYHDCVARERKAARRSAKSIPKSGSTAAGTTKQAAPAETAGEAFLRKALAPRNRKLEPLFWMNREQGYWERKMRRETDLTGATFWEAVCGNGPASAFNKTGICANYTSLAAANTNSTKNSSASNTTTSF